MTPRKSTMKNKRGKKLRGGMLEWLFGKKTDSPATESSVTVSPSTESPLPSSVPVSPSPPSPSPNNGIAGGKRRKTSKTKTQRKR